MAPTISDTGRSELHLADFEGPPCANSSHAHIRCYGKPVNGRTTPAIQKDIRGFFARPFRSGAAPASPGAVWYRQQGSGLLQTLGASPGAGPDVLDALA